MFRNSSVGMLVVTSLSLLPLGTSSGSSPIRLPNKPLVGSPPSTGSQALFVPNVGQFDSRARFQAHGSGGTLWLADDAVWLTRTKGTEGTQGDKETRETQGTPNSGLRTQNSELRTHGVTLKLTFPGMNPNARLMGEQPQPTRMNYLIRRDATHGYANIPTFGSVRWAGLYSHLDLVFTGAGLVLDAAPDYDGSAFQMQVEGADALRLQGNHLFADTAIGPIQLPDLWNAAGQPLSPIVNSNAISLSSPSSLSPIALLYSTFLGGINGEEATAITVDASGSAYLTGSTLSNEFPTTPGAFDNTFNRGFFVGDAFVTKLTPDGHSLVYSTFIGGSNDDAGYGITVDSQGSTYVTGATDSDDFPITAGAFDNTLGGLTDAFITKLSADGSSLVYSTYVGGAGSDYATGIAVSALGAAYITGRTESDNYPTSPSAYDTSYNGGPSDAFITKLNNGGSALTYSTFLGGADDDTSYGIVEDTNGTVYVAGTTFSTNFPTTAGAYDLSYNGGNADAFVTKLNNTGSDLIYSTYLGGSACGRYCIGDNELGIALDTVGSVYIVGYTDDNAFPTTPGAYDTTYQTGGQYGLDAFLTKLTPAGGALVFSTFLGGSSDECYYACSVAVRADGSVVVAGQTYSGDFPTTTGALDRNFSGTSEGFVTEISLNGGSLDYSTFLGGSDQDGAQAVGVDGSGGVYVAGQTGSADFPTTPNAFDTGYNGGLNDVFVSKLTLVAGPTMHVASITPRYRSQGGSYRVGVRIVIQDANGEPVPDAAVTINVTLPNGNIQTPTRSTDATGTVRFVLTSQQTGTYTFTVIDVVKSGVSYDRSQNVETSDSITIP